MEIKSRILLLLLGSLLVVGTSATKVRDILRSIKEPDEETARILNARYEETIEESWKRNTKADDQPSFWSPSFNSMITGKYMSSIYEKPIYAFQGLRYAEAVRFQPPTPVDKFWDGDNFDAIHIGFKCPQGPYIGHEPSGNEDCLFLNVYTPVDPANSTDLLPVMFFIHGGAYTSGDASLYLPTRLLEHPVILVTIHYRLGAFGFFTLNSTDAPGNLALYDMVEALNWTQTYIQDFGGNASEVTIFGESAGSVSVNYMMLAETAGGMFRAVIAESGSCLEHWALDEDPIYAAHYNAKYVGCDSDNDTELLNCMMEVPTADLVSSQNSLVADDRKHGLMGFRGAGPTIQSFMLDEDADFDLIVTKRPKDYFMQQDFEKVPFMTGSNKQEGSFVAGVMYQYFLLPNNLLGNSTYLREQMVQDILESLGFQDDTHALATSLQLLYCPDIDLADTSAAIPCIIDMLGPLFLKAGSWQVANYHSYFSDELTFYYSFEFESDDTMLPFLVGNVPFDGGITHSDELMYIFDFPAVMDEANGQLDTVNRMTKLWTNFATYLHPTPADQEAELEAMGIPLWTPFRFENHSLLVIADKLTNAKEYSDRWTITVDEIREDQTTNVTTEVPNTTGASSGEDCTGECADIKDQRDAFEITMIIFIVLTFIISLIAVYFFFKARR